MNRSQDFPWRIGIDLGGSKIEGILLDSEGRVCGQQRVATPQGDYRATVAAIAALVAQLEQLSGAASSVADTIPVGIGAPGAISPHTGRVKNSNSTCLIGQPLDQDLAALLRRPVRIANDADCFALSEAVDGAGAGHDSLFGAILGTGVGGGVVIGQQLLRGANAIAGEWGHNPLPWPQAGEQPGPRCYCGQYGCIETFLSGPALAADHQRHYGGAPLTAMAIDRLARQGDREAEATMQRYEERLARALATLINIIDPHVIVLGGGVSNMARLYDNVPRLWCRHVFSDQVVTRLLPARFGDASGVRGAAWLW
ncbi:MAG: ROK family protein [Magnetococcales bacterium]|nr:ROK family protein [Magnetococcales bacterium]